MKFVDIRTTGLAIVAFCGAAGIVAAQGTSASPLLGAPQVREMMERSQPADHARLRLHFDALSAKYTADAARHTAFERGATGMPRGAGAAASAHHNKLAAIATESASITRELAAHHGQLGAGVASTAPLTSERFEHGAGAPATPSEKQLLAMAAKASTPSEHGALQEYYDTLARGYDAEAKDHRTMAQSYRGLTRPTQHEPAVHCDRLVQLAGDAAKEARALAAEHKQMATGRR